jgi:carbamoyltransferase
MIILGINNAYHECAAALLVDGRLVAAAEQERFNRVRHGKKARVAGACEIPLDAINYCLQAAGLTTDQVNFIAYSFDPDLRYKKLQRDPLAVPGDFGSEEGECIFLQANMTAREKLQELMPQAHFEFMPHHLCHAASAYLAGPFEHAGILVADGVGENCATWLGEGKGALLNCRAETSDRHSLGFLWEKIAEFLGFDRYEGPGKLMGLAGTSGCTGRETGIDYLEIMHSFINLQPHGFEIDPHVLRYREPGFAGLSPLFGEPRNRPLADPDDPALAAALQKITEQIMLHLADELYRELNSGDEPVNDLCLAGGVALNCVAIGELARRSSWQRIWVQPACNDAGTAIGAALLAYGKKPDGAGTDSAGTDSAGTDRVGTDSAGVIFLGPQYDADSIRKALESRSLPFREPQHPAQEVAALLERGRIVALFDGKMEFGPRALGARSILVDPRRAGIREELNRKIKKREEFRPFAPSMTAQAAGRFFDSPFSNDPEASDPTNFMLAAVPVRDENAMQSIPAVIQHNPDTAESNGRIQVIDDGVPQVFARIIEHFGERTGCPVVLNTSFNVREPIVMSPDHALDTFSSSALDALLIGPYLVTRP